MHTGQLMETVAQGIRSDDMVRKVVIVSENQAIVVDKRGNVFEVRCMKSTGRLLKDEELD